MTTLDNTITIENEYDTLYHFSFLPNTPKDQPNLVIRNLDGTTNYYRISLLNTGNNEKTDINNTLVKDVEHLVFELLKDSTIRSSLCNKAPENNASQIRIQSSETSSNHIDVLANFATQQKNTRIMNASQAALTSLSNLAANQPKEDRRDSLKLKPAFPAGRLPTKNTNSHVMTAMTYDLGKDISSYNLGAAGLYDLGVHDTMNVSELQKKLPIVNQRYEAALQHTATVLSQSPPDILFLQNAFYNYGELKNQPKPLLDLLIKSNEYGMFTFHKDNNQKKEMDTLILYKKTAFSPEDIKIIDNSTKIGNKTYAVGTLTHKNSNNKLLLVSAHITEYSYLKDGKIDLENIIKGNTECDLLIKKINDIATTNDVDGILIGCNMNAGPTDIAERFKLFTDARYLQRSTTRPTALNTKHWWQERQKDRSENKHKENSAYPHTERHLDHFFFKNFKKKNIFLSEHKAANKKNIQIVEISPFGSEPFPLWNPSHHLPVWLNIELKPKKA